MKMQNYESTKVQNRNIQIHKNTKKCKKMQKMKKRKKRKKQKKVQKYKKLDTNHCLSYRLQILHGSMYGLFRQITQNKFCN